MKPQYKKETIEHILKHKSCFKLKCMSCYFGRYEKQTQIRINGFYSDCELNLKLDEKVYDLVCVLIDLEEKLEEIVNV